DQLRHSSARFATFRGGCRRGLARATAMGRRVLPARGSLAAPPGGRLPRPGAATVAVHRLPHRAVAVAASVRGPEGGGRVGPADAAALRRGGVDCVSANADARHPGRVRDIMRIPVVCIFASSFILHPSSFLRADGGTLCLLERAGGYQVAVFSSPTPLRAGPV